MTKYLLDTNHASAIWQNLAPVTARIAAATDARFSLPLPCVGELWFMVFKSARVLQNEQSLWQFLGDFHVLPFDSAAAIEFGRIKAELKKLGRPIPAVDAQIAAIARSAKLIVLTADGHFSSVQGLTTENWLA